jgi:hypothetical protein
MSAARVGGWKQVFAMPQPELGGRGAKVVTSSPTLGDLNNIKR